MPPQQNIVASAVHMNVSNKRKLRDKILMRIQNSCQSVFIHLESSIIVALFRNGDTQGHFVFDRYLLSLPTSRLILWTVVVSGPNT